MPTKKHPSGIRTGRYKSRLEATIADQLDNYKKISWSYETKKVPYVIRSTYTPDFIIGDNVWVEAKGYMDADERRKFQEIRKQYPLVDIRFVFSNWDTRCSKGGKMTYRGWAEKYNFRCADKTIPTYWIKEFKE